MDHQPPSKKRRDENENENQNLIPLDVNIAGCSRDNDYRLARTDEAGYQVSRGQIEACTYLVAGLMGRTNKEFTEFVCSFCKKRIHGKCIQIYTGPPDNLAKRVIAFICAPCAKETSVTPPEMEELTVTEVKGKQLTYSPENYSCQLYLYDLEKCELCSKFISRRRQEVHMMFWHGMDNSLSCAKKQCRKYFKTVELKNEHETTCMADFIGGTDAPGNSDTSSSLICPIEKCYFTYADFGRLIWHIDSFHLWKEN